MKWDKMKDLFSIVRRDPSWVGFSLIGLVIIAILFYSFRSIFEVDLGKAGAIVGYIVNSLLAIALLIFLIYSLVVVKTERLSEFERQHPVVSSNADTKPLSKQESGSDDRDRFYNGFFVGAVLIAVVAVFVSLFILPRFYAQTSDSTEKLSPAQALVAKGYLTVRVVELDKKLKEGEAEIESLRSQLSQRISRISNLESQLVKGGAENEKLRSQLAQAQTAQRQAEKARRTAEQAQRRAEEGLSGCRSQLEHCNRSFRRNRG